MGYLITLSAYAGLALMLIMPVLWLYTKKKHLNRLEKSTRLVFAFTATGFAMAWLLLGVYTVANRLNLYPSTTPLFFLCPSSIASLILENTTSWGVILFAWLMISLSNAALYAVVGMFFAVVLFLFWKLNSAQTDN
ncbi:MAG: hypothetical protein ACHP8B_00725 [Terriglobales bacterium]